MSEAKNLNAMRAEWHHEVQRAPYRLTLTIEESEYHPGNWMVDAEWTQGATRLSGYGTGSYNHDSMAEAIRHAQEILEAFDAWLSRNWRKD